MNFCEVQNVFVGYTNDSNQYLIWVPERKNIVKTTNPTFIKNQPEMSEPSILNLTELEEAQQERAQQIKIQSPENITENSSDENENLNPVNKVIQTFISENQENDENQDNSDSDTE